MTKNILVTVAFFLLLSSQAMASKARMQALGQPMEGSFYLMDSRNVFKNPATIGAVPSHVVVETGSQKPQPPNSPIEQYNGTPGAEAGFFREFGGMKAGFFVGREHVSVTKARLSYTEVEVTDNNEILSKDRFLTQTNPFEVFIGQDMEGMTWAGSIYYSAAGGDAKESSMAISLGAMSDEFEVYLRQGLSNTAEYTTSGEAGITRKFKGNGGTSIGGAYHMGDYTVFADYKGGGHDLENATNGVPIPVGEGTVSDRSGKYEGTNIVLGISQQTKFEEKAFVFWAVEYMSVGTKAKSAVGNVEHNMTTTRLPFTVGMESPLSTWLTVRGSLRQSIFLDEQKTEVKGTSTTTSKAAQGGSTVNVGLSFIFDKVSIDGTLSVGETGYLNFAANGDDNHFLSNLSVSYIF